MAWFSFYDRLPLAKALVVGYTKTRLSGGKFGRFPMIYGKVHLCIRGKAFIGERLCADARLGAISIKVAHGATLTIGEAPLIGYGAIIESWHDLKIGDYFMGGPGSAVIDDHRHPLEPDHNEYPGRTVIGDNVWLGRNVVVTPGVTIGEGSVIGANSVVTKDIPPNVFAAGAPARVIKKLELKEGWTRRPKFREDIPKILR
jgi:acetyltransferase-like isoleucine patch superfamily enzyme